MHGGWRVGAEGTWAFVPFILDALSAFEVPPPPTVLLSATGGSVFVLNSVHTAADGAWAGGEQLWILVTAEAQLLKIRPVEFGAHKISQAIVKILHQ